MRVFLYITGLLLFTACSGPTQVDKTQLDGYWQIEKVVWPNGREQRYQMSQVIDYIQVRGDSGIRKKVKPQLDGSFRVNQSAERFVTSWEDDSLRLEYSTPYDTWVETVIRTADSSLVLINRDGKTYHYRKFRTFNFNQP